MQTFPTRAVRRRPAAGQQLDRIPTVDPDRLPLFAGDKQGRREIATSRPTSIVSATAGLDRVTTGGKTHLGTRSIAAPDRIG
jgi:hypothetical protein